MSKKLWFYYQENKQIKVEATLTNLKTLLREGQKNISIKIEKLDSNWFVDWTDQILIQDVDEETILGEYPYISKIPKRIRTQISKALNKKGKQMTPEQYHEEQMILHYLTVQDSLMKEIQYVMNQEETLGFTEAKAKAFPFMLDYYHLQSELERSREKASKSKQRLKELEKAIIQDLDDGGWDFIKDSSEGFELLHNLYLSRGE